MKTVKIPARLRRIMGLAPVLEFELSSVRPVVVVVVLYVLNIMYVIIIVVLSGNVKLSSSASRLIFFVMPKRYVLVSMSTYVGPIVVLTLSYIVRTFHNCYVMSLLLSCTSLHQVVTSVVSCQHMSVSVSS